jgi:hypothetical protein
MNEYMGHICQMCEHKDYCYFGQGKEIDTCVLLDNENKERSMDDICVGGGYMATFGLFDTGILPGSV